MSEKPTPSTSGWTPEGMRAWNNALVKTGMEQLDLGMVRQGKKGLQEAAMPPPAVVAPKS